MQFFLAIQGTGYAVVLKKYEKKIFNQTKAEYGIFTLPALDDSFSNSFQYHIIRFSIEPSFSHQVAYEFLFNYWDDMTPQQIEKVSKYVDIKNVLFRKYEISDDSIAIHSVHKIIALNFVDARQIRA